MTLIVEAREVRAIARLAHGHPRVDSWPTSAWHGRLPVRTSTVPRLLIIKVMTSTVSFRFNNMIAEPKASTASSVPRYPGDILRTWLTWDVPVSPRFIYYKWTTKPAGTVTMMGYQFWNLRGYRIRNPIRENFCRSHRARLLPVTDAFVHDLRDQGGQSSSDG